MTGKQKDTLHQTIFGLDYQSWTLELVIDFPCTRAIVRTLNSDYSIQAFGLGGANTTYPISAFITDMVYLKGTRIKVDVEEIVASDIFDLL
jgi:hypothetical protein